MSYAKCFEDNLENAEENVALYSQRNSIQPIHHAVYTVQVVTYPTTKDKLKTQPEVQKREKRKKKKIVCAECNEVFLFTGGEQNYYERHHLSEPKRCTACRRQRKELFKSIKKCEVNKNA